MLPRGKGAADAGLKNETGSGEHPPWRLPLNFDRYQTLLFARVAFGTACFLVTFLGWQEAVFAEVCDKTVLVPENWQQSMGPHSLFFPLPRLVLPLTVAGLATWFVWYFALRRTAFVISAVLGLLALLMFAWAFSGSFIDEFRGYALLEGCYSTWADVFSAAVLLGMATLFAVIGWRKEISLRHE